MIGNKFFTNLQLFVFVFLRFQFLQFWVTASLTIEPACGKFYIVVTIDESMCLRESQFVRTLSLLFNMPFYNYLSQITTIEKTTRRLQHLDPYLKGQRYT